MIAERNRIGRRRRLVGEKTLRPKPGHKPNGQFAKGNPGGPGRPSLKTERNYLRAMSEVVTIEDWQAIVRRAVTSAKNGGVKAREWLSHYLLGKEPPTLEAIVADDAISPEIDGALLRAVEKVLKDHDGRTKNLLAGRPEKRAKALVAAIKAAL